MAYSTLRNNHVVRVLFVFLFALVLCLPGIAYAATSADTSTATSDVQSGDKVTTAAPKTPTLTYRSALKGKGWQPFQSEGEVSGKTGNRVTAVSMKLHTGTSSGAVRYRVKPVGKKWLSWKKNGKKAAGGSRGIEALKIELVGTLAKNYSVYYRVRIAKYGWLDWAKNGAVAGDLGLKKRIQCIRVKLVKNGARTPSPKAMPCLKNKWQALEFSYRDNDAVWQLLEVKYTGGSNAKVALRQKTGRSWKTLVSCYGYVGKAGIGKASMYSTRTPQGDFGITKAFGIRSNPGAQLPYVQVTSDMWWCGDRNYYNQLIYMSKKPHYCTGEHLIDYAPHYNYGLFFDYNTNPITYGAGAAFFFHCTGGTPYTGGCIAVSQSNMIKIIQCVSSGARLCIYPK